MPRSGWSCWAALLDVLLCAIPATASPPVSTKLSPPFVCGVYVLWCTWPAIALTLPPVPAPCASPQHGGARAPIKWSAVKEQEPDDVPPASPDAYDELEAADAAARRVRDELGDISEGDEEGDDDGADLGKFKNLRVLTRNLDSAQFSAVKGLTGKQRETAKSGITNAKDWLEGGYKVKGELVGAGGAWAL